MRLTLMGLVCGLGVGLGNGGCQGNTIELEMDAGGAGTASPGDDGMDSGGDGNDSGDVSDGADADTGPIVTSVNPNDDTGDREPAGLAEGRYLLVVSTIIDPGLPLQWEVNVTRDPDGFAGQSLTLDQGSITTPREPIGGVWDATMESSAGELTVVVPPLQILGEANPLTGGVIVTSELTLSGRPSPAGDFCGDVTGEVVEPLMLMLAGSSFALVPVEPGEPWPVDFPFGC